MANLVVQNVTKRFGRQRVLDGVELHVAAGTVTTLLGASGSGKTTLLRLLCGFERPDAGTIRLDGTLVAGPGTHLAPEHRGIGYVPQDGALFPHLSVAQNIVFGLPRRERSSRAPIDRLLALMGLPPAYGERRPHELSGGEQQRVALARALAATPRMVLLDEPFSSLDAALRVETRRAVSDAIAAVGATALLVTHDQAEALSMGGQVAVLRDGRMVQVDAPPTLYRRPVDLPLARFVGEAVVLPGEARGERVACALGSLRLARPAEGSVDVMLRPEQIRVHAPGEAGGIPATVAGVVFYGHDASITAALDGAPGVTVTVRTPGHVPIEAGDRVRLSVAGAVMGYPRPAGGRVLAHAGEPATGRGVAKQAVSA